MKTDVQYRLDQLNDSIDRRELITSYEDAWSTAVLRHLGGRAISSMSQIPQTLFGHQLPPNKPRFAVRNSDDFFPDEPTSHSWHVFCNAHNAVLTQHLNIVPDWDMFQTNHAYSSFHAAARCVSGGMIYITDEPGSHDMNLLSQISASTPDRTIILRPAVGRATQVYMAHNETAFCKIRTSYTAGSFTAGILGVFNTSKTPHSEFLSQNDILGSGSRLPYLLGSYQIGNHRRVQPRADQLLPMLLDLGFWGWDILSAYPLLPVRLSREESQPQTEVAVLGLLHKMTGVAALTWVDLRVESQARRLNIKVGLKALGALGTTNFARTRH